MKNIILLITFTFITHIYGQCENIQNQAPCNNNDNCMWYSDCGMCVESIEPACPIDNFLDVSQFEGAGGNYPDPQLSVSCDNNSINVSSNGIIHYPFVQITPNNLQSQNYNWDIPRYPIDNGQNNTIPLLGVAGIAVNGLPFFGPNEAQFPDPYGDPVYNGIMDYCMGHTAQQGVYHYHAMLVECLSMSFPINEPDPVVGYANDGYPIYGPIGCIDAECSELVEYSSGWVQTGDPTTYAWDNHEFVESNDPLKLDECNGHYGPNGDYHYHATSTFPYIVGCYHGTQNQSGNSPDLSTIEGGDLNQDELINVLDVIQSVNLVLANSFSIYGDVNDDCEINVLDIVSIVNIILGII